MKTFSKVSSQKIHVPHILSQETPGGCSQTNDSTKNEKALGSQESVGVGAGGAERNGISKSAEDALEDRAGVQIRGLSKAQRCSLGRTGWLCPVSVTLLCVYRCWVKSARLN